MNLNIYKYNNYYNRMVKYEETLADYGEPIHILIDCKDFSPNDGVNTVHVFGSAANNYDGSGDYLIVSDEYNNIITRWFIIEINFTRQGQWNLTLRRDLIVDYYEPIVNAPCFIEKAILNANDPLIFNSENTTVNQIKTKETLIKDKSQCPWFIGYYAKNTETQYLSGTINRNLLDDVYDILIDVPFENWEFNATINSFVLSPSEVNYRIYGMRATTAAGFQQQNGHLNISKEGNYIDWTYVSNLSTPLDFDFNGPAIGKDLATLISADKDNIYNEAKTYINPTSEEDSNYFLNLGGKIVKDSLGAYYQLSIDPSTVKTKVINVNAGSLFNTLSNLCQEVPKLIGTPNTTSFKIYVKEPTYTMSAIELTGYETTWDMSGSKLTTEDAPYNIFAIPYGEVDITLNDTLLVKTNAENGIATANSIIQKMGSNLYDIQLLPYCPLTLDLEKTIDLKSANAYSLIQTGGESPEIVGVILNIPSSRFTKNIYLEEPIVVNNAKIENECDVYKLCSPNWASEFQFSAAKNNGVLYFNIDCEYKPFSPYIHINPNFGGLYGRDFDDARGLILSGDFSLTQIENKWQEYQIQNKNFQNIFDRQIQNMEVQHNIARIQEKWAIGAGTGQGAAAGALAGSMLMPGVGGIPGAIVGGAASLIGGITDISMNEQLRTEALDYTKDLFGYQLGNIQALPYTLTKVSSFNNNNKLFPVLEYYTCTDREKEALANKIAWNGMTVMAIGAIANYIGNTWSYNGIESKGYIKGQIIRIEDLEDEFHLLKEISNEIYKGVYF